MRRSVRERLGKSSSEQAANHAIRTLQRARLLLPEHEPQALRLLASLEQHRVPSSALTKEIVGGRLSPSAIFKAEAVSFRLGDRRGVSTSVRRLAALVHQGYFRAMVVLAQEEHPGYARLQNEVATFFDRICLNPQYRRIVEPRFPELLYHAGITPRQVEDEADRLVSRLQKSNKTLVDRIGNGVVQLVLTHRLEEQGRKRR